MPVPGKSSVGFNPLPVSIFKECKHTRQYALHHPVVAEVFNRAPAFAFNETITSGLPHIAIMDYTELVLYRPHG